MLSRPLLRRRLCLILLSVAACLLLAGAGASRHSACAFAGDAAPDPSASTTSTAASSARVASMRVFIRLSDTKNPPFRQEEVVVWPLRTGLRSACARFKRTA